MHTEYSDGKEKIKDMAMKAVSLGYEYIAVTDHVGSLRIANAMNEMRIIEQKKEIDRLNLAFEKSGNEFKIIQGAEVNIKSDGKLDMSDSVLKNIELVLASIHSGFSDDSQKITQRIISAMENENVDVIAHPTGRKIFERTGYTFDLRKVIDVARSTGTLLEIDSHANRLDLNDENSREVFKAGLMMSVDTDSHAPEEMDYMQLGIGQARRAWAEKKDILNTKKYKELMDFLES